MSRKQLPPIGLREQRATRLLFFIAGLATAAWAALIPFVKQQAQINDGMLGVLLLFLGVGSIMAMPVAGAMATRYGCRRVLSIVVIGICISLPILVVSTSFAVLACTLFVFGACVGSADCTFNMQAVIVEKASNQPLMSGFHGHYSIGGIAGAAGMSIIMAAGVTPVLSIGLLVVLIVLLLWISQAGLLPYASPAEGPSFAIPKGIVLLIGVLCFIVFLAEGAVLDWSAVFLTEHRGLQASQAGFGFASFALTMTLGRLSGDRIVSRLGSKRVMVGGAFLAVMGILLTLLFSSWEMALLGYALVGLGCSNIVPVLFSSVGRQTVMPQSVAIPAITTLGYAGVLVGPAGIGLVAHHSSLNVAFFIVAALMALVMICSLKIKI